MVSEGCSLRDRIPGRHGFTLSRAVGGDRHHRRAGGAAVAGGAVGPRGGPANAVRQQPQADRPGDPQFRGYLQKAAADACQHRLGHCGRQHLCHDPAVPRAKIAVRRVRSHRQLRHRPQPHGCRSGCGLLEGLAMPLASVRHPQVRRQAANRRDRRLCRHERRHKQFPVAMAIARRPVRPDDRRNPSADRLEPAAAAGRHHRWPVEHRVHGRKTRLCERLVQRGSQRGQCGRKYLHHGADGMVRMP